MILRMSRSRWLIGNKSGVSTAVVMAPPWPEQGGHFYCVKTGHFYCGSTGKSDPFVGAMSLAPQHPIDDVAAAHVNGPAAVIGGVVLAQVGQGVGQDRPGRQVAAGARPRHVADLRREAPLGPRPERVAEDLAQQFGVPAPRRVPGLPGAGDALLVQRPLIAG